MRPRHLRNFGIALALAVSMNSPRAGEPHNLILFVPDGLRAAIVDATTAPAMARLRDEGVNFRNSHSLLPTFTTANASAFATGHLLGDTGDFSNTIYTRLPFQGSVTPFLENDVVLRELNAHLGGSYLHEPTIVGSAAALPAPDNLSTAVIGKLGPVAIFDPAALAGHGTLIIDDNTGQAGKGIPIPEEWRKLIEESGIRQVSAPSRSDNAKSGTFVPNFAQQQYFLEMAVKVVLPRFKKAGRPFVMVYWSRDPDGSQHTQGDGGINGPTSLTAIRATDGALAAIEQTLKALDLYDSTNIIVAADHGFSTIDKRSENGARHLPAGFLALDLTAALRKQDPTLKLFDPDADGKEIDVASGHPEFGNGLIGRDARQPRIVVAANGGSDLIYLPARNARGEIPWGEKVPPAERARLRKLARSISRELLARDYVSGFFVDESQVGPIEGALPMSEIGLVGAAITPHPAIVVNFRSYIPASCDEAERLLCAFEVVDHPYPDGGGMHGSFSRADSWNFMAARGPDFRARFIDPLPASNADIGATMAELLGLRLTPKGNLTGRVLSESMAGHENDSLPQAVSRTLQSKPGANGLKTLLRTQTVEGHTYFDVAGFSGRAAGLDD